MTTPTQTQVNTILKDVQDRLDRRRDSSGIDLTVNVDATRCDDDWLYVVVTPAQQGVRAYDYVQTLSAVEKELRQNHIEKVLLVAAIED